MFNLPQKKRQIMLQNSLIITLMENRSESRLTSRTDRATRKHVQEKQNIPIFMKMRVTILWNKRMLKRSSRSISCRAIIISTTNRQTNKLTTTSFMKEILKIMILLKSKN
jgi:hypothetical protein